MNRRRFLKQAGLWVPAALAFPAIVRAQRSPFADPSRVAAMMRRAAAPAGTSFFDDFNRANASPMSAPPSGSYDIGPGASNSVDLNANKARAANAGNCCLRIATPAFTANQWASIVVTDTAFSTGPAVRIASSTDSSCYKFKLNTTAVGTIRKVTDTGTIAVATLGAIVTLTATVVAGDVLKLTVSGTSTTTLELFLNGVSQGTRTDSSSPFTTGQPGIWFDEDNGFGTADDLTGHDL